MILYRKGAPLRVRRVPAPEAPFWAATAIAPYGAKRAAPIAIDYLALRASGAERVEAGVSDNVGDELDRMRTLAAPVLIDAAESAEVVFRRGEEALAWCEEHGLPALLLVSSTDALPSRDYADTTIVLTGAGRAHGQWGVAVPIMFPITTDLALLEKLADDAHANGASFFVSLPIELDPTAKQALAQSMQLAADDDRYAMLFHASLEPIHLATERHVAALAHERGLRDFIVPPRWDERSNWNAAVVLAKLASRMIALELDLDLAGQIARSARAVAELDKPLARIAAAASLGIIDALDPTSVDVLTEWIASGEAGFVDYVDEQWRLRRG